MQKQPEFQLPRLFYTPPEGASRPEARSSGRQTTRNVRRVVHRLTLHYRKDLNAARTSAANSSGSSQAAKWPPRSTSLK